MQSMTINMRANIIKTTAKGIVQVPKWAHTIEVAKEKMAKKSSIKTANTNEIKGIHRGRQWVKVILNNPHPMAINNK